MSSDARFRIYGWIEMRPDGRPLIRDGILQLLDKQPPKTLRGDSQFAKVVLRTMHQGQVPEMKL